MKKILLFLFLIPIFALGQGTQNLTVKRLKTDSLYVHKLATISNSRIVLVLDSATGKIGKRPYPTGAGMSQDFGGNPIYFYNDGTKSIAIGNNAAIPDDGSGVSIGGGAFTNYNSVALGFQATAQGEGSVAIGPYSGTAIENEVSISSGRGIEFQIAEGTADFQTNVVKTTGGDSDDWNAAAGWVTTNGANVTNWNDAYFWGDHAGAGYIVDPGNTENGSLLVHNGNTWTSLNPQQPGLILELDVDNSPIWDTPAWIKSGDNLYNYGLTGKVGIGTTNPTGGLHAVKSIRSDSSLFAPVVFGGSLAGSSLTLQSTSGTPSGDFVAVKTGGLERMRVVNGGNVGIGTTNPAYTLEVIGSLNIPNGSYLRGSGNLIVSSSNTQLSLGNTGGGSLYNTIINVGGTAASYFGVNFNTIEKFRITSTGNVGIGTTAPTAKLHLSNDMTIGTTKDSITIDTAKTIRLYGNATYWDDLFFPFNTGSSGGNSYPTFNADSNYYTFVVDSLGTTKCFQYFTIQLPHRWKEGSKIYPHVHYKHETGVGTPNFIVKYKWYTVGGTTAKGWGWYRMGNTTGTTDKTHQLCYGDGGISGAGMTLSSILVCQVYLRTTPANVNAWQFDVHIECDKLGSDMETSNN